MISQTYYDLKTMQTLKKMHCTQAIFVSWVELLIIVLPWLLLFTVIFFFLTGIHSSFLKHGFQDLKILSTDIINNNFFSLQLPWILICVEKKRIIFPISLNLSSRHWRLFEVLNNIHWASRGLLFRQDPFLFPNNFACKEKQRYLRHSLVKIN